MSEKTKVYGVRLSPEDQRKLAEMASNNNRRPAGFLRNMIRLSWEEYQRAKKRAAAYD